MASQWYRKVDGGEVGPVTFPDLVDMILAGTLTEDDWVRRDLSPEWIRARAVIGLFQAAQKKRALSHADDAPSAPPPETSPVGVTPAAPAVSRRRKFRKAPLFYCILGAAAVLLLAIGLHRSWTKSARKFPEHRLWGAGARREPPSHPLKVAYPKPAPPTQENRRSAEDAIRSVITAISKKTEFRPTAPLVTLLPGHGGVRSVAFSPDGRTLATSGDDGKARLWALGTLECLRELDDHLGTVNCAAFSPDGTRVALGGADRRITLWDTRDGRKRAELRGHTGEVSALRFSPDGKRLASSAYDGDLCVWDVEAARMVLKLKHLVFSHCVDWSPDGRMLCAGVDGGWETEKPHLAILWNAETGQEIARLPGHRLPVTMVRFSPDGKRLATGGSDSQVLLWDVASRKILGSMVPNWGVPGAAFLPDGQTLAVATHSGRVSLWSFSPFRETLQYEGHSRFVVWSVYGVAVSPDGSVLASADKQGMVKFWPTFGGRRDQASAAASLERVATVAGPIVPPPGATPPPSELIYSVRAQVSGVLFATFSPDGTVLAAGGEDGTIVFLEAKKGRVLKTLRAHEAAVYFGAFSPDGRQFATGGFDRNVKLWDVASGSQQWSNVGAVAPVKAVAFTGDGESLVSASETGLFKRWETKTGRELSEANLAAMASMALSPEGNLAATANRDANVGIWSLKDFKQVAVLKGHPEWLISAAFSPDGRMLVSTSASFDPKGNVKLWNAGAWTERAALEGHRGQVHCATFSPDGKTVATAGSDLTVRLWNAADGKPLKALRGHTAAVVFVRFSPDGRRLASASLDGTVKVWNPGAR